MNQAADRKKLRREYLSKKWGGYAKAIAYIGCCAYFAVKGIQNLPHTWRAVSGFSLPIVSEFFLAVLFVAGIVVTGSYIAMLLSKASQASREASQLPYVPPVSVATLPVEEVLLRGTTAGDANGDNLVRPTTEFAAIPTQELLRSSQRASDPFPTDEELARSSQITLLVQNTVPLRVADGQETSQDQLFRVSRGQ